MAEITYINVVKMLSKMENWHPFILIQEQDRFV
jgi:hypothetical protein